jgi:hypothetical protein
MVVTLSALLSCSQNFGRLMSSSEVTLKFKQYQVDDTFNYYLFGQQSNPTAIIGLNKDVTLESSLWQKIDFDAISLQTLVDRVSGSTSRNGAFILDPQGNRIGVWFAGAGTATIKMAGEKRIAYISPSVRVKQRSIFSD